MKLNRDKERKADTSGPLAGFQEALTGQSEPVRQMRQSQIDKESGGRQFDQSGKPLVGRYRDGSMPKEDERAYGVAQIQVGTAKETARKHGIPWSESRLMNDSAYNRKLGDLHMSDLRQRYGGDERLAQAAYHSGTGNVDRAIAKYGVENMDKGLGPHGRAYIAEFKGGRHGNPGGVLEPANLEPNPATEAEIARLFAPLVEEVVNPNTRVGDLRTAAQGQEAAASGVLASAMKAFEATTGATPAIQEVTQDTVAENAEAHARIQQQDTGYRQRLSDLWGRRMEVVERKSELRKMNPLARLFKGLGDSRYNEVDLNAEDADTRERLAAEETRYKMFTEADSTIINHNKAAAENRIEGITAPVDAANLNLASATRLAAAAGGNLSAIVSTLQTQTQLDTAQNRMKADVLTNHSEAALAIAETAAEKNGGLTQINGVELSVSEIRDARLGMRRARISSRMADLSAQAGEMELQDHAETQAVESLTAAQRQQALANGGVINGMQLNPTKLAEQVQKDQQFAAQSAAASMAPDMTRDYATAANALSEVPTADLSRLSSLGAGEDSSVINLFRTFNDTLSRHATAIRAAQAAGTAAGVIPTLQAELSSLAKARNDTYEQIATRWAGGNPAAARVAKSYLLGENVSQADATKLLIAQARGGAGRTLDLGPGSASTQQYVQQFVTAWDQQLAAKGAKANDVGLIQALSNQLNQRRATHIVDSVFANVPLVAKNVSVNGQPHPLSRIPPADFQAALRHADSVGARNYAAQHNIKVDANSTPKSILAAANAMKLPNATRDLISAQLQATFSVLDSAFSSNGFDASAAFADLISRPEFESTAAEASRTPGSRGKFGDYVVNNALGTGGSNEVHTRTQNYRNAYVGWRESRIAAAASGTLGNTQQSTFLALASAIDGITPQQAQALSNFLDKEPASPLSGLSKASEIERVNSIGSAFARAQMMDPELESARKIVLREWPTIVRYTNARLGTGKRILDIVQDQATRATLGPAGQLLQAVGGAAFNAVSGE